ncbi:MAG: hypothetical protein NC230_08925 [Bacteroides sp.]|nr:hypothetical protein [Bacteroides sp.]
MLKSRLFRIFGRSFHPEHAAKISDNFRTTKFFNDNFRTMCKILSRIKTLADSEGISIGAIERAIGASRGVISKAITKGTDIQSKWLELICEKFPQYSPIWLLTGEGDMLREASKNFREATPAPPETTHEKVIVQDTQKLSHNEADNPIITQLIRELRDLAIENGRLKERIAQLEREKNVSSDSFATAPREMSPSTLDL